MVITLSMRRTRLSAGLPEPGRQRRGAFNTASLTRLLLPRQSPPVLLGDMLLDLSGENLQRIMLFTQALHFTFRAV